MQIDVDDELAQVPSMVAIPDDELPVRTFVSIWVDMHDTREQNTSSILAAAGIRRAGYLVTESLYRDYGGNEHAARDWPDGERSPGIVALTIFDKPPRA